MWVWMLGYLGLIGMVVATMASLFREEDYVPEGTDFATMTDEAFFFNWGKMNYGMEIVQRFHQLGPWEHIMTGVITRRPALGQTVLWIEPIVLINCDLAASHIQVPPEVWLHAFSDANDMTRLTDGEHPNMRSLLTVPKIVFMSQKAGFILKVIPQFLWLLAQDRVQFPQFSLAAVVRSIEGDARLRPLQRILDSGIVPENPPAFPDFTPSQYQELNDLWQEILPLQQEVNRVLATHPALEVGQLTLEILIERVYAMVAYIAGIEDKQHPPQPEFMAYVEECWLLHVSHLGEYISPAEAVRGQHFTWECTFLRARTDPVGAFDDAQLHTLAAGWADPGNRRIRRTDRVGDKYYLDTTWAWWAFRADVRWENVWPQVLRHVGNLPLRKVPPQIDPKAVFRILHAIGRPNTDLFLDVSYMTQFRAFCRSVLRTEVTVLDWRQGLLLFADDNDTSRHYILKVAGPPYDTRGYVGEIQAYLDLFIRGAGVLRVFSLQEGRGIVELHVGAFASFLRSVGYADFESLINVALLLRTSELLNVNLIFGDLFVPKVTEALGFTAYADAVGYWNYYPATGRFETVSSLPELDFAREVIGRDPTLLPELGPIQLLGELMRIKEDKPPLYSQLQTAYEDQVEGPESRLLGVEQSLLEKEKAHAGGGRFTTVEDIVEEGEDFDEIETDTGVSLRVFKHGDERDYFAKYASSEADARDVAGEDHEESDNQGEE